MAALSARWLAEAARREGYGVLALDAFGDTDTREASLGWAPVGEATAGLPRLDAGRLALALRQAARQAREGGASLAGWVAGPGCEHLLETLQAEQGDTGLPALRGNPAAVCRAAREPGRFMALLERLGLPYPPTRLSPPPPGPGWLRKDRRLSGGWGVERRADTARFDDPAEPGSPDLCWQRELQGEPWSLLFLAGAPGVRVLGTQRQHTLALGTRAHVLAGLTGPLTAPHGLGPAWAEAALALSQALGLRGLGSLDLIVDRDSGAWQVLELNPRPSASLQLYPAWPLLGWHLQACGDGRLPGSEALAPLPLPCQAWRVVHAPQAVRLRPGALARWARSRPGLRVRDLPDERGPAVFAAGQPVCSLSLEPADLAAQSGPPQADALQQGLARAADDLISFCTTLAP